MVYRARTMAVRWRLRSCFSLSYKSLSIVFTVSESGTAGALALASCGKDETAVAPLRRPSISQRVT
jgi:hypothetical protein